MSQLLHTTPVQQTVPPSPDVRYAAKAASYARDYRPPPDDVQLLFFSVETSGFIHRMAKDHLLASSNVAYIQALQSISVALQSARAHSISVAREFLPNTAGPLPPVPPLPYLLVSWFPASMP